jgi:GNAT superfamily N-acetyltransferase
MVLFELAHEKDAEILKEIGIKAFEEDKKQYGSTPPGIDSVDWHLSQIKSGMYYKIIYDGQTVGGIKLFDMKGRHYRLGSIYILPDFQNHGIGHKAIEFIEKVYPDARKWSLDTPYKSYRNHYFYEKHGYVKVGETQPEKENGFYLFLYEKNIDL